MLAVIPAAMLMLSEVSAGTALEQTSGPRPTSDPDAIPDGKAANPSSTEVSFNLSMVSDYRFRGISQSSGDPAIQAAAEVTGRHGGYAGTWGSTIAGVGGAPFEVDVYAGYRTALIGADLDVGAISYLYPGADGASSFELYATCAHEVGMATLKVGGSYTPHQPNLGNGDGSYLFAEIEQPFTKVPATLRGHVGRESGVSTPTGSTKVDWLLGIDVHPGSFTLSIAWVAARYHGRSREAPSRSKTALAVTYDF